MSLDREETSAVVAAGLCLTRLLSPSEAVSRVGPWIVATLGERIDLPPVGVIADLGAILFGTPLDRLRVAPAVSEDPALAAAVRRYEDAVLGRLAVDGRLASAGFAVARLPPAMHAQAVGILVGGVLARIGFDAGFEVQPGVVRALTEKKPAETLERGFATIRDRADVRARLTTGYLALARSAQRARELIGEADLFALENLLVLGSLTQRLAIADVVRAQESIALGMPRRAPRRRRMEGDLATNLEDESVYPVGGFASVSTMGSLENLVSSELIYMDPPPKERSPGAFADVDLFDMRYVEGELLYYTRDESILVRRRRLVLLVLPQNLVRARVKDRGLPWQRIILALAVVLVVTKKLFELLGDEALEVRVVFLAEDGERSPLAEEKALSELMLREWREKGVLDVLEASWEDVLVLAGVNARRSLVEIVRMDSAGACASEGLDARVVVTDFPLPESTLDAWRQATAGLLAELL